MKKVSYLLATVFIAFALCNGCKEDYILSSSNSPIEYLSFKRNGCISTNSSETSIEWIYINNKLSISTTFTTHISAMMKDSVLVNESNIEIFLSDTSGIVARGLCPHNVLLEFKVEPPRIIKVTFYYKAVASEEYHELIRRDIKI